MNFFRSKGEWTRKKKETLESEEFLSSGSGETKSDRNERKPARKLSQWFTNQYTIPDLLTVGLRNGRLGQPVGDLSVQDNIISFFDDTMKENKAQLTDSA